ncbi:bone morphogenetic protein 7 [Folsomia candida]|uniref:bone morphogenetic protein 7 n=1 Tax=Folsomia candida TaxID=158441 RepID=UPI000B8F4724|nr:bone morphogenetic protein 7 [Folsomia candida]
MHWNSKCVTMASVPNILRVLSAFLIIQSLSFHGEAAGAKRSKTPSGLYVDDGKGHTVLTQKFSKKDVREISYDILNIMGFNHRPHPHLVDKASPASQFLLEVYNSMGNEVDVDLSNGEHGRRQNWRGSSHLKNLSWSEFNVDQTDVDAIKRADAIISFVNRGHRFSDRLKQFAEDKQFWFDVSEVSDLDLVLGAELRIWKRTLAGKNDPPNDVNADPTSEIFRVSVHQVSPGADDRSFELTELDEIMTAKWEQGWLRFNVTSAFRKWIHRPSDNLGLVISTKNFLEGTEVPMLKSGLATIMDPEEHQPFLVSFLESPESHKAEKAHRRRPSRVTRSAETGGANRQKRNKKTKKARTYDFPDVLDRPKSCQMGMLYVNFEDLGWKDWVIAPDGFIAYYCHGECSFPLTASMNATNHAIVSTLVHTYYPMEYPKPSCSPVKLGSISMLYYDDLSNVTVKKYKDMVIKSCGCK